MTSTTGRIPAMAAPTPSPTIAVSEIGVSRTRSPKRSRRPRVRPKTLPPAPTSTPATKTRSSVASSDSSAAADGVHGAEHLGTGGRRRRLGVLGRGRTTKSKSVLGGRAPRAARAALHGLVELGAPRRTRARRARPRRRRRRQAGPGAAGAGRVAATPPPPPACGSAAGHPRSGRASGRWRPRPGPGRPPVRAARTTSRIDRRRGHHVVPVDVRRKATRSRRHAASSVAACWSAAAENSE